MVTKEYALGGILLFSTVTYVFFLPKPDPNENAEMANDNNISDRYIMGRYWGKINAEIDWCELNHQVSYYIAEPINTFTGLFYVLMALYVLVKYYKYYNNSNEYTFTRFKLTFISFEIILYILFLLSIGISTALFHASLRYSMQLFDELSIYYCFLILINILYYQTNVFLTFANSKQDVNSPKTTKTIEETINALSSKVKKMRLFTLGWIAWITLGLLMSLETEEEGMISNELRSIIHEIFRAIMSVTFLLTTLVSVWYGIVVSGHCKKYDFGIKIGNNPLQMVLVQYIDRAMWSIIISFICWLSENLFCNYFLSLPIPYLQFHAVWHIGTCLLLFYIVVCLILYQAHIIAIANQSSEKRKGADGKESKLVIKLNDQSCLSWLFPVVSLNNKNIK